MNLRVRNGKYVSRCTYKQHTSEFATKYDNYSDDLPIDKYFKLLDDVITECLRVSKLTFFNIQMITGNKIPLLQILGKYAEYVKDIIIWDKLNGIPAMRDGVLNSQFEFIIIFDSEKPYNRMFDNANFDVSEFSTGNISSILMVDELPDVNEAIIGMAYHLIKGNKDYVSATYSIYKDKYGAKKWIVVGAGLNNAYKSIEKLGNYLYAVRYDNIDYNYGREYYEEVKAAGCTSIKTGKYLGRNLDWYYDNTVEFVVQTPASDGRHAVVGVTATYNDLTKEVIESGEYNAKYKFLPFCIVDGMNDTGLAVSVNITPLENYMVPTTGTHPEITDINHQMCASMIPRWILDNYSVDKVNEAFNELHDHYNIYVSKKFREAHYEPQYLINGDYWYFKDNELHKLSSSDVSVGNNVIMTNFRLHDINYTEDNAHPIYDIADHTEDETHSPSSLGITAHGSGLERFNLANAREWNISLSIGYAKFLPEKETLPDFIVEAQKALAEAKKHRAAKDS